MLLKKKIILLILTGLILYSSAGAFYSPEAGQKFSDYQPTRIIVKFKSREILQNARSVNGKAMTGIGGIDQLAELYAVEKIEPLFQESKIAISEMFTGVSILTVQSGSDIQAIAEAYANLPEVEFAEPDYMAEFHDAPDDPHYIYQWSLQNIGQEYPYVKRVPGSGNDTQEMTSGIVDADIDRSDIEDIPPDQTHTAVVAILDTGVDLDHPDLADNIWVNTREIADNGIDDDNNGYIDDINGWDFSGSVDALNVGDNDPTDERGHGTHCAGIVAAVSNNATGITGIVPDCKIMALKIDPLPLASKIAQAIVYAADNGADVMNMSFGLAYPSDLVGSALLYARTKGVVLCASSGNDGQEQYNYPASYPFTLAIGATNDSDYVTTFSTFGDKVDLSAPGRSILSLRADNSDLYSSSEPGVHIYDELYFIASGTSMSCPHVAGIAAYMRSVSPGLMAESIETILKNSADDIIDPYGIGWNMPGWDMYSGHGRANMYEALQQTPIATAVITGPVRNQMLSGNVNIVGLAESHGSEFWHLEYGEGDDPEVWYPISEGNVLGKTEPNGVWNTGDLNGVYTIRMRVGNYHESRVKVYVINRTMARIESPLSNGTIDILASVTGAAYCPEFSYMTLESLVDTIGAMWETVFTKSIPVFDGVLAYWSLLGAEENLYQLRLMLYSENGLELADTVAVNYQSLFKSEQAWKVGLPARPSITPTYADLDQDGINEIIVGTETGVLVYNLDGSPKTEGIPSFPESNFIIPIAVGNLDNDGYDDIVLMGVDPPFIYGYPSSAPPFINHLGMYPTTSYFSGNVEHRFPKLFLKDIDSDNRDEIHVVMPDLNTPAAILFESDGSLRFRFENVMEYLPADVDGDGYDELYTLPNSYGLLRQIDQFTGLTTDSLIISIDGSAFDGRGFSAVDIDSDTRTELIVFGLYRNLGYYMYAFDENLNLKSGWPHDLAMTGFVAPTVPVFGDIDNDGTFEYASGYFDLDYSYMFVWNIDGSSYIPGSPFGFFAQTPQISLINMPTIADIDADNRPDIIACANNDAFYTYRVQRIYAWNNESELIDDFPLIANAGNETSYYRMTPMIGDINRDGMVDMIMTTSDWSLIYINFPGKPYNPCKSFAPSWRYDRAFSATLPGIPCQTTGVENPDPEIPDQFILAQNYPNPFNPSTVIKYSLPSRADVEVTVYDILGRKVKTLINAEQQSGSHSVIWDGTNSGGAPVSSGIYFYRIKAGDSIESKKMMLLK